MRKERAKATSQKRIKEDAEELEVLKAYDLNVKRIKPVRKGFKVKTDRGDKFLKEIKGNEEDARFVNLVMEHFARQGFYKIARFIPTKFGDPYARFDDKLYYLTEWIDGKECNLRRPLILEESVRTLAQLHKASAGFSMEVGNRSKMGKWPGIFKENLEELVEFKKQAEGKLFPTQFDQLFIEKVDYYHQQGLKAVENLDKSRYNELVEEGKCKGVICHRDFIGRNLIKVRDNEVYIVDFDHCGFDLAMYDLSRFLGKYLPKHEWDQDVARFTLNIYNSIQEITNDDYDVLMAFMQFPRKFHRLANQYYKHNKDWTEELFLSKLNRILKKEDARTNFLATFAWP